MDVQRECPDAVVELAGDAEPLVGEVPPRLVGRREGVVGPREDDLIQPARAERRGPLAFGRAVAVARFRGGTARAASAAAGEQEERDERREQAECGERRPPPGAQIPTVASSSPAVIASARRAWSSSF
ncbi:MAG: hypothetical protein JST59_16430 [Actinobacteria bacterium]|nr:hypothetical protein [Actinomycetota bacterium]